MFKTLITKNGPDQTLGQSLLDLKDYIETMTSKYDAPVAHTAIEQHITNTSRPYFDTFTPLMEFKKGLEPAVALVDLLKRCDTILIGLIAYSCLELSPEDVGPFKEELLEAQAAARKGYFN